MYQLWLINCNKCTILMQDANNRGNWVYGNFVLFSEFLYKPKTGCYYSRIKALRNQMKLNVEEL